MGLLRLVKPSIDFEQEYIDMLDDWKKSGEKLVPWVLRFETIFRRWLKCLKDIAKELV